MLAVTGAGAAGDVVATGGDTEAAGGAGDGDAGAGEPGAGVDDTGDGGVGACAALPDTSWVKTNAALKPVSQRDIIPPRATVVAQPESPCSGRRGGQ